MFGIVLVAPLLQLIFLGYAANLDVTNIRTAFFDQDKTKTSREFIEKFESSGYFSVDYYLDDYKNATDLIDQAKITVCIVIPKDFERKIKRKELIDIQAVFDGSDGNKAGISAGYVRMIVNDFSKNILLEVQEISGNKFIAIKNINAEIRVWYNPEMKTRVFMVPAVVALLLMIITLLLTSLAIVKEKENGTLEQLIVSPIKPLQLILGKLIPFIILGFIVVLIVVNAMSFIFDITIRGNLIFLLFSSFLFILSSLGLGLFISTISKTQQQAMMLSIFGTMMPMIYLSGFAFPIENMPEWIQYITYIIPLRYFITIIRGVILKGIGFNELWLETLLLFLMGIMILVLSAKRFRKRLD